MLGELLQQENQSSGISECLKQRPFVPGPEGAFPQRAGSFNFDFDAFD
jgi:hypothetical protein